MKQTVLFFLFCGLTISALLGQSEQGPLAMSNHLDKADNLEIFPNPVLTDFKVRSKTFVRDITVYDLAGNPVAKFNYKPGMSCNVSNLPKGLYLVQFVGSRDKVVGTRRLRKR